MSLASFIDLTIDAQARELYEYYEALGAKLAPFPPTPNEDDHRVLEELLPQFTSVVKVCDLCFKDKSETEVESILNSIVSMLVLLPASKAEPLILTFCEKITEASTTKLGQVCLKVLWLLFHALDTASPFRFHVYYHLVQVAGRTDQVKAVFSDIEKLKSQLGPCHPTNEQMQKLLRIVHEALLACRQSESASKVMLELLSTYTTENASQAREEAQRCIVASLADPSSFLLDHLLALQPVKVLEGALLHDLLTIFVSDQLQAYLKFYQDHKDFIDSLGLKHDQNIKKMRLLTFMQMAEGATEISFDSLQQQLQLKEEEVEEFVIEVLKTKLVRARMDQSTRKVLVFSTMHRTFGKAHWQQLRDYLTAWRGNLHQVRESMATVVNEQAELMLQLQV